MLHSTDALPLPPRPDVSQYRKLAKDLLAAVRTGEPDAVRDWARAWSLNLWRLSRDSPDARRAEEFARDTQAYWKSERIPDRTPPPRSTLAGAQFFIARVHGFAQWADLVRHIEENRLEDTEVGRFEAAVDAIVRGDTQKLRRLLRSHPELATARSNYAHGATLLHYVSANGVEGWRQRTPPNIVEITKLLLGAGSDVNAGANCYGANDTTVYLAATSMHPANAGVMIDLLQVLLSAGADINRREGGWGIVRSCLANGQGRAAWWLAQHGAEMDLEEAAGIGDVAAVKRFVADDGTLIGGATAELLSKGFGWAAAYGRLEAVQLLLDRGADPTVIQPDGSTYLHMASYWGARDVVELLLSRGAPANVRETSHDGTPIDWAIHGWGTHDSDEASDQTYYAIVASLARAGSEPHPGWSDPSSPGPAWKRLRSDPKMLAALEGRLVE